MPKKSNPEKAASERCGFNLRNLRKMHRLKAREVGDYVGLHTDTILKYERGEREPSFFTLILFGYLYGVSIDRIICGVDNKIQPVSFASADKLRDIVVVRDKDGIVSYIGPNRRQGKVVNFRGRDKRNW